MVSGHPGFSCSGIGSPLDEMMHARTHTCSWTHAALKTPASLTQYSKSCHWNDDHGISRHQMKQVAGGCTPRVPPTGTCRSGGGARALPSCCPRSPSRRGPDGLSRLPVAPFVLSMQGLCRVYGTHVAPLPWDPNTAPSGCSTHRGSAMTVQGVMSINLIINI